MNIFCVIWEFALHQHDQHNTVRVFINPSEFLKYVQRIILLCNVL